MKDLFTSVLISGLYGSVIIFAVVLFRVLAKKTPGKWLCLLWLLAFLRLAMPFQIESSFSLQPDVAGVSRETSDVTVRPDAEYVQSHVPALGEEATLPEDITYHVYDVPPSAPAASDTPSETHVVIDWLAVGSWVWLTGCVGFLGYGMVSCLGLKRRVREAVRCADGVWECAGLETAFIFGFLRPRIYIPMGTSYGRAFILTHERSHIARGDHWWKLLGYLILAVHWYNPLVWMAYLLLCRDMERACDERVVRHMTLEERKAYSTALLSCSTNRRYFAACPVAFGEISVKGRIQNVLNYRKPGVWVTLIALAVAVILIVCFMTTPKPEASADPPQEPEGLPGTTLLSSGADGCVQTFRMNGDGDPRFGYVIRDKAGNIKRTENGLAKEPLITELDGNIVKISMRTGTGMSTNWAVYYDAENQWFSQKYHFVLAEYGRQVAVYSEDENIPAVAILQMFGFDVPLKNVPLTGLEPGVTEPIKAVFRSSDGQLCVTYNTGKSEHTMMIDMALGSEMTDLELLAWCRAGLERYRSWGNYSFLIDRELMPPGQHTPETEEIYQIDGDYYRHRYYRDGEWRVFEFWLQKDGEQFTRSYRDVHEGTVMPVDTGWVRESFTPEQPWAWTFDFDAQEVTILGTGEESGRKFVELLVAGAPGSHAPDVQEYTVRFVLDGSGVPDFAVLSYGDVKETIHFNSASEDMILMTFEAMYSQAQEE